MAASRRCQPCRSASLNPGRSAAALSPEGALRPSMLSTIIRERTSSVSPSHENHLKWTLPSCETCEKRQGAISTGSNAEAKREEKAAYQRFRWHHRHESRVAAQTSFIHSHLRPLGASLRLRRERMHRAMDQHDALEARRSRCQCERNTQRFASRPASTEGAGSERRV
jgi:hypothetical protein